MAAPRKVKPPAPPFIPARWHGGHQEPAKRIVIHGTVSPTSLTGDRAVAAFFQHETNKTSAHYIVDPDSEVQCVGDHTVAYHAPPNQDTIGVELCDPQTGPGSRWHDTLHEKMLVRAAALVARLGLAYGIPLTRLTVGQLKAGKHGICGHVDVSNAWHQTTHTDPGSAFPWDHFMDLVAAAADKILKRQPPAPPAEHHLAIDYSWARPDPAAIKAAGYRGVFRYLSHDTTGKNLTKAEAAALHAAGLWVIPIWENGKSRAKEGAAAGRADRLAAEKLAAEIGISKHVAILYAVDYDAKLSEVAPYLDAVREGATHPFGVYGGVDVIDAGMGKYGWQTEAWSEGHVSTRANVLQLAGKHTHTIKGSKASDWDENRVLHGVIPAWLPGQKPPPPPPPPVEAPSWVVTQANVQETDSLPEILRRIHTVAEGTSDGATPPDVIVWNELGGKHQKLVHAAVKSALPGFDSYIVEGVGISWRTSVFLHIGHGSRVVNHGVAHFTPDRPLIYVDLTHTAAGKAYRQEAGHSVHHVEDKGLPRIKGALLGQNRRARRYFAAIADDFRAAKAAYRPCVFEGDLNVDLLAELRLPAAKRCKWFPLTVLDAVGRIKMPHEGTHGRRAIDWNVVAGRIYVLASKVLPHGSSDHNSVQHVLSFERPA